MTAPVVTVPVPIELVVGADGGAYTVTGATALAALVYWTPATGVEVCVALNECPPTQRLAVKVHTPPATVAEPR